MVADGWFSHLHLHSRAPGLHAKRTLRPTCAPGDFSPTGADANIHRGLDASPTRRSGPYQEKRARFGSALLQVAYGQDAGGDSALGPLPGCMPEYQPVLGTAETLWR